MTMSASHGASGCMMHNEKPTPSLEGCANERETVPSCHITSHQVGT